MQLCINDQALLFPGVVTFLSHSGLEARLHNLLTIPRSLDGHCASRAVYLFTSNTAKKVRRTILVETPDAGHVGITAIYSG